MESKEIHSDLIELETKIAAYARANPDIAAVYLFGSYAAGRAKKRSDLDLGVLFHRKIDGFARIDMETELSNLLRKDVDLIDMGKSGPVLRHQIHKHGRRIYKDETDFALSFREVSIRDYLDTQHLRDIHKAYLYGQR